MFVETMEMIDRTWNMPGQDMLSCASLTTTGRLNMFVLSNYLTNAELRYSDHQLSWISKMSLSVKRKNKSRFSHNEAKMETNIKLLNKLEEYVTN